VGRDSEKVDVVRGDKRRRLHKAFLRYHDPNNWPLLREALKTMGRADLIGNGKQHLIPRFQPLTDGSYTSARRANSTPSASSATGKLFKKPMPGQILTQHTGLPPRVTGSANNATTVTSAKSMLKAKPAQAVANKGNGNVNGNGSGTLYSSKKRG
jgi:hypothetical protein